MENKKYYLNKDVFKYQELTMREVRLLVLLTSSKITVKDLSYKDKLWIVKNKTCIKEIDNYVSTLIKLRLLNSDGTGLVLKNKTNSIILDNLDVLSESKTLRQLFYNIMYMWTNNKFDKIYLSIEQFQQLFGTTIRVINQNIHRLSKDSPWDMSWELKNNKIIITYSLSSLENDEDETTKAEESQADEVVVSEDKSSEISEYEFKEISQKIDIEKIEDFEKLFG